jgi:NAD(P)-dependent dehydrogenase (short-subunit alcohol dehydrogenase family)
MDKDSKEFEKYSVTQAFLVPGKKILIIGATGNWGSHFAVGMAFAAQSDLVLVDDAGQKEAMENLVAEIFKNKAPIQVETYLADAQELQNRSAFYEKMEKQFGKFAAIMDVEGINTGISESNE